MQNYMTSVATFFTKDVPNLRNVERSDTPHMNPDGFTFSTIATIMPVASPGLSKLHEEWLESITSSTSGCLVGWCDDYTSFTTRRSASEGAKRSMQNYMTSVATFFTKDVPNLRTVRKVRHR